MSFISISSSSESTLFSLGSNVNSLSSGDSSSYVLTTPFLLNDFIKSSDGDEGFKSPI